MALGQYVITFIPRKAILDRYNEIPEQLSINEEAWKNYMETTDWDVKPDFEDAFSIEWWKETNAALNDVLPFAYRFGELQEWTRNSKGQRKYGDSSTDDICICFLQDSQLIEELSCRLIVNSFNTPIVDIVFDIAKHFDCLLMDNQARLFEPNFHELWENFKLSDAYRFALDPIQFFKDLSESKICK